jgi:hypothetical protein
MPGRCRAGNGIAWSWRSGTVSPLSGPARTVPTSLCPLAPIVAVDWVRHEVDEEDAVVIEPLEPLQLGVADVAGAEVA